MCGFLSGDMRWQREVEGGSLSWLAGYPNLTVILFNKLFAENQTQSRSFFVGGAHSGMLRIDAEDFSYGFLVHPHASICNRHNCFSRLTPDVQLNGAALRRELDCVRDQVAYHSAHGLFMGTYDDTLRGFG